MVDLTGLFECNDGGIYWVRQVGNDVYWFGRGPSEGNGLPPAFSNVFIGTISGNSFSGNWGDVPMGKTRSQGRISPNIDGTDHFTQSSSTGGFGGTDWKRARQKS